MVIPTLHGGGAELVLRHWIEGLVQSGHDLFVYTYEDSAPNVVLPDAVAHRRYPSQSRLPRMARLPIWLRLRAHQDRLDVLVSMLTYANLAALVGLRVRTSAVPVIITEHNMPTLLLGLEGRAGRLKRSLARRLYRRANAAIGVSHAVAGDLVGGYSVPGDSIFVVPNPILRLPRFADGEQRREPLHLIFVGRMVDQKRPRAFVDVLIELRRRGVNVRGTMIGDGADRSSVEAYARAHNVAVFMAGWREPWWEGLDDVDCLVLPSVVEGLGNVLVEAAAAGIKSVARSSALGVADAVMPGVTGDIAIIGGAADLADAVLNVVGTNDRDAIDGWLRRFSIHSSVASLERVLEHVVARH